MERLLDMYPESEAELLLKIPDLPPKTVNRLLSRGTGEVYPVGLLDIYVAMPGTETILPTAPAAAPALRWPRICVSALWGRIRVAPFAFRLFSMALLA